MLHVENITRKGIDVYETYLEKTTQFQVLCRWHLASNPLEVFWVTLRLTGTNNSNFLHVNNNIPACQIALSFKEISFWYQCLFRKSTLDRNMMKSSILTIDQFHHKDKIINIVSKRTQIRPCSPHNAKALSYGSCTKPSLVNQV